MVGNDRREVAREGVGTECRRARGAARGGVITSPSANPEDLDLLRLRCSPFVGR